MSILNTDLKARTREEVQDLPSLDTDWQKGVPYRFGNLVIVIEFLAGDERRKVKHGGTIIKGIMPAAYGCILGTTDAHGEEIDMYLAPMAQPSDLIFVIDQVDPVTGVFDEHKVMLGFGSTDEATHVYQEVFADGSGENRLGAIVTFTEDEFAHWLSTEGTALSPASDCRGQPTEICAGVKHVGLSAKSVPVPRDETGGVAVKFEDLSQGPKIKTHATDQGGFAHHIYFYSALDMEDWSNAVDTICRTMELASPLDEFHIHEVSPGGSVVLMGRLVSAMYRTKAKVVTYAESGVASAAVTIWAAGHERHISPSAFFMQHMSSQLLAGKTTDIASKAVFCRAYIERELQNLIDIGLFTQEEVSAMSEGSYDIYVSGIDAIRRVGAVSTRA